MDYRSHSQNPRPQTTLSRVEPFIDGIGHDRISDITTNVVRGPLIEFTQDAAAYYGIPLKTNVGSARCWDQVHARWEVRYVDLPIVGSGPLILVPKCLVRRRPTFDSGEYLNHHILPILQEEERQAGSSLVEVLKDGTRHVTKKSVKRKYGHSKRLARDTTARHPEALERYRAQSPHRRLPNSHEEFAKILDIELPEWNVLLESVLSIPAGREHSDTYHRAVQGLLSRVFYPALVNPTREFEIHEGRKRIDITFTNEAQRGFFSWVDDKVAAAPLVHVECKNYGTEIANPELDQITGRFSLRRGQLGIVCCRAFKDRERWDRRCRDTASDGRGYVLTLDDEDLRDLVEERQSTANPWEFGALRQQLLTLL